MTTLLHTATSLVLLAAGGGADLARYNQGLESFNAHDYDTAAKIFNDIEQNGTDTQVRLKAQYYLADSFFRKGMPVAAMGEFYAVMSQGTKHPFYLKAVEGLVQVQRALNDKGHHVEITGAWDERTRDALADLQAASGLPATGTMNRATARLLGVDPYAVVPVGGRDANPDPTVNCNLNNTVDCRPGA